MEQQKLAKHLIDINCLDFDHTAWAITEYQTNSEKSFFGFVDKNPLFTNNSSEAIYEYLLSARKRHYAYKPIADENHEKDGDLFIAESACKADH